MPHPRRMAPFLRGAAPPLLVLALTLLLPAGASAHGIGLEAQDRSVLEFVPVGMEHMLLGWDHLLFIVGIVLVAGEPRRAAKLISVFVLGHSLTLIVATVAGWQISPTAVDVVIALSLVFVGVLGIRGRPDDWAFVTWSIFGFGLIHGLGLSTRLQDLGLPEDGLLARVIAFNIGIELGQLLAIGVIAAVLWVLLRTVPRWQTLRQGSFVALAGAGFLAAAILALPEERTSDAVATGLTTTTEQATCARSRVDPPRFAGGGHPGAKFVPAGQDVAPEDVIHVITDGYAVVHYQPKAPSSERQELEQWINGASSSVLAVPAPDQEAPYRVQTAFRQLECEALDLAAMRTFTDEWLADVKSGRAAE